MERAETVDEELLQVFICPEIESTTELSLSCPFLITFRAKLESASKNFVIKHVDSTWSEQLWAASVHKKMNGT